MELTLTPNIAAPDDFYAALLATHDGLTRAESEALNARLILILAKCKLTLPFLIYRHLRHASKSEGRFLFRAQVFLKAI